MPPEPSVLRQKFPSVATRLSDDDRRQLKDVFNAVAVKAYGPFMRGVAHVALAALRRGVDGMSRASTSGDINVVAAQLIPVYFLFARDSAASDMLRRYYMHVVLLCDFHAWQAIERKLSSIDRDLRSSFKDGLRDVFADAAGIEGPAWTAFQSRFRELSGVHVALDTSESGSGCEGSGSKRVLLFDYIKTYWLSPRWLTTVSLRFRALFQRAGLNTTNDVELFWCVYIIDQVIRTRSDRCNLAFTGIPSRRAGCETCVLAILRSV